MVSNKDVANEIIKLLQGSMLSKKTKNKIIKEIRQRLGVGSVMVTDVLSQLKALKVVSFETVGRAEVYSVNKENLKRIEEIKD
jgi:predicted transcriptional regulator